MKRTIEIEDNLDDYVVNAVDEVKTEALEYIRENVEAEDIEELDIEDIRDAIEDRIWEICDSNVPVYYYQIDACWFLNKNLLQDAYENMGMGDNPLDHDGMTAIFCYINQEVNDQLDETLEAAKLEVIAELENDNEI